MQKNWFNKFEEFIRAILLPIADKIDKNPYLTSVKKGMVVLTPALLLGSFSAIFPSLPEWIDSESLRNWFASNGYIFNLISLVTLGLMGLYALLSIAYFLSEHFKLYTIGSMILATIGFLIVALGFKADGSLDIQYLGSKGLFTAIFVAIISVLIYHFFTRHKMVIKMPEGVPDFVSSSFELITPTVAIGLLFMLVRGLTDNLTGGILLPQLIMNLLAPAIGGMDNMFIIYLVVALRLTFWFFGIHSAVLSPVLTPIFITYLADNLENFEAGLPLQHVVTGGTMSAFVNFTGSGVTIGLVIAMLISKSERYRKTGMVALFPSCFGINEPVLFGMPIVLNPILMIPFIFGGAFVAIIPYFAMKMGLLNYPIFDPPYVPIFMEGFLTAFDWRSIPIQLVQIVLSCLLYFPFFKIMEKQDLDRQKQVRQQHQSSSVISKEDEKLIADLDF